jgi:hypothetical protein
MGEATDQLTTDQLKADIEFRRQRMSGTVDAIEDRVVPGRIIRRRTEAARGWMGQARTRVMGPPQRVGAAVGSAPGQAASAAHQVADGVTGLPEQISDQTRGAPLVAGGLAFGLGALVALLLPETPPERHLAETLEPQMSAIADAAKETAQAATASVKDSAEQAVGELKDVASEHVGQATEQAKGAAEQVASTARDEAPTGSSKG